MSALRDPFFNPFPADDPDRRALWEMLVLRDIAAFTNADWPAIAGDFIKTNFTGFHSHYQSDPAGITLAFPTLDAYRQEWQRQSQDFVSARAAGAFAGDPCAAIFRATRLERIEIDGLAALVHKTFDGRIERTDGGHERLNWQTLYVCRRDQGRWKIAGFVGYLPHVKD